MAYSKTELKKLEKDLSRIDGIIAVSIEQWEGEHGQALTVKHRTEELGDTDFTVETAEAFDTFEELQDYCKSKILHDIREEE